MEIFLARILQNILTICYTYIKVKEIFELVDLGGYYEGNKEIFRIKNREI